MEQLRPKQLLDLVQFVPVWPGRSGQPHTEDCTGDSKTRCDLLETQDRNLQQSA